MADSDDEYDRKRRDKFRGERTESYREGRGREDRRRAADDWPDRYLIIVQFIKYPVFEIVCFELRSCILILLQLNNNTNQVL